MNKLWFAARSARLLCVVTAIFTGTLCMASISQLSVSPTSLSFGSQTVGSKTQQNLTLTNHRSRSLSLKSVTLSDSTDFALVNWTGAVTLEAGKSMTLTVAFTPHAATTYNSTLTITGGVYNRTVAVPLSGTGVAAAQTVSIAISPTSASLQTGAHQQFTAAVSGTTNTAVTWKASAGTVSSSGAYTAPTTTGSATVTATSVADPTKSATATVSVTSAAPAVSVSVSPASATIQAGGTQQFTASVSGSTNTAVTWKASAGTISTSGAYKAPSAAATATVTATSVADPTKSATATVQVTAAPSSGAGISVSPSSATVAGGATYQFTATVTGTTNTAVQWAVAGVSGGNASVGTISSGGLYTAPSCPANSTQTITATSAADSTAKATASVSITTSTASNNYYVATNGSDSNDGSACHPWATVQHAANVAQPGWTINILPGTYNQGSAELMSNNGGTFTGSGCSSRVTFKGNYDPASKTWNSKIVTSNPAIWELTGACIDVIGLDVSSTQSGTVGVGIKLSGNGDRVIGNHIHSVNNGSCVMGSQQANYLEADGNLINRCGATGLDHGVYFGTAHDVASNNLIYDVTGYCIQFYASLNPGMLVYDTISNNTGFGCHSGMVLNNDGGGVNYATVTNNIFRDGVGSNTYGMCIYNFGSNMTVSNNIIDNFSYLTDGGFPSSMISYVDPKFVNYQINGTGDYHLQSSSPAVDAGTSAGAPKTDFDGYARPYGSAVDIGAYEWHP